MQHRRHLFASRQCTGRDEHSEEDSPSHSESLREASWASFNGHSLGEATRRDRDISQALYRGVGLNVPGREGSNLGEETPLYLRI